MTMRIERIKLGEGISIPLKFMRVMKVVSGKELTVFYSEAGMIIIKPLSNLTDIFSEAPSVRLDRSLLQGDGITMTDLAATTGIVKSKGEARRIIEGGGLYLQNVRVTDPRRKVSLDDAIEGQAFVLRKGQREYRLVLVEE